MTNRPKGGDDGDSFDFSKYAFGKRGAKGFQKGQGAPMHQPVSSGSGGSGKGGGSDGDDDLGGGFDWESEPSDEDLKKSNEENEKFVTADITQQFETIFRSLASKVIWDVVWTLARSDKATMTMVVHEIIRQGTNEVAAQLSEECKNADEEDREFMSRVATRALRDATATFESEYTNCSISRKFAAAIVKSVRKNLKK